MSLVGGGFPLAWACKHLNFKISSTQATPSLPILLLGNLFVCSAVSFFWTWGYRSCPLKTGPPKPQLGWLFAGVRACWGTAGQKHKKRHASSAWRTRKKEVATLWTELIFVYFLPTPAYIFEHQMIYPAFHQIMNSSVMIIMIMNSLLF